jgi:tripartite-type tricarboxylate transporter receptor subunit TctC
LAQQSSGDAAGVPRLTRRRVIALSAAAAVTPVPAKPAAAQAVGWPNRSVRLLVPLAPGGPTDAVGRIVAEQLSKRWGQQVVVENKPGGGTNLASEYVAHSDADGYTLLFGTSSLAVNATLYRSLSYDPVADLAPVSLVAKFPFFMFVPNSSPATTVMQFIAAAKAHPARFVMGSPGTGSGPHLAEELFLQMAGLKMTHAPYRGAGPAFIDLIPGRIDCYFGSGELLSYSRSGQVRVLGTSGARRSPAEPEVPTIAEAGVPGYEVESWQGVFAPAKTPPELVQKISADIGAILAVPAVAGQLSRSGYAAGGSSPGELAEFLKADTAKWNGVIKTAGIKID